MKSVYRQRWFWYWVINGRIHPDHTAACRRGDNTDPGWFWPGVYGTATALTFWGLLILMVALQ